MKRELAHLADFMHMAVDYAEEIGFAGQFLFEPKPKEPTKHQYDFDVAACMNFLRVAGLADKVKMNIETNHATLAGHTMMHEMEYARIQNALGSIDANTGDLLLGWDTDQFPTDVYLCTRMMLVILENGGLAPGGTNFDAKVRRESVDPVDLFHAHVGGMDAFARGAKIAAAIRADGVLKDFVKDRYASYDGGLGAKIEAGGRHLRGLRGMGRGERRADALQRPAGNARERRQPLHLIPAPPAPSPEAGRRGAPGPARPPMSDKPDDDAKPAPGVRVGFDLGGTKMYAVAFDADYKTLGKDRRKTKGHLGEKAGVERMTDCVRDCLKDAGVDKKDLAGIGVGVPGVTDLESGVLVNTPNLGWTDVPLRNLLHDEFGCPRHALQRRGRRRVRGVAVRGRRRGPVRAGRVPRHGHRRGDGVRGQDLPRGETELPGDRPPPGATRRPPQRDRPAGHAGGRRQPPHDRRGGRDRRPPRAGPVFDEGSRDRPDRHPQRGPRRQRRARRRRRQTDPLRRRRDDRHGRRRGSSTSSPRTWSCWAAG